MAKNNSSESGSNWVIFVLVILIVGGGVFYGLKREDHKLNPASEPVDKTSGLSIESNPISDIRKKQTASENSDPNPTSVTTKSSSSAPSSYDGQIEEVNTNKSLPKYTNENQYYFSSSFDFAWPAYSSTDMIIEHDCFALKYNEKMEQADWVAYKLTRNNLDNASYKRQDNFREDPLVSSGSASSIDYKGSGFDRGHLAPAADFKWTKKGLDDSFYMSNMSPQKPEFNRGIWKKLEEKVRMMAKRNGEIYVVTGPIYQGYTKKIGLNKVGIPSKYYKVILELEGQDVKGIGFVLANEKSTSSLSSFAMSIDDVEKATKLDFFPGLPDDLEKKVESRYSYNDW